MKVNSFVDCTCDSQDIGNELINKLPDKEILNLASVLIINTGVDMYVVKIRRYSTTQDGDIDLDKTYSKIKDLDFIEISRKDYEGIKDWRDIKLRTRQLIGAGEFLIYKL